MTASLPEPSSRPANTGDTQSPNCTIDGPCVERSTTARGIRRTRRRPGTSAGFTLFELMIAMTITGVLSSVAIPSFQSYLHKARRAEVMVLMMQVQLSQSRWRSYSTTYGSLADIGVSSVSTGGHYTLQLNSATPESYEVVAIATGSQAHDSKCRYMKLSMVEADVQHNSGAAESVANDSDTNRQCWNQ